MNYMKIPILLFGISCTVACFGMDKNSSAKITTSYAAAHAATLTSIWAAVRLAYVCTAQNHLESCYTQIKQSLDLATTLLEENDKQPRISLIDSLFNVDLPNKTESTLNLPYAAIDFGHLELMKICTRYIPHMLHENHPNNILLIQTCQTKMHLHAEFIAFKTKAADDKSLKGIMNFGIQILTGQQAILEYLQKHEPSEK